MGNEEFDAETLQRKAEEEAEAEGEANQKNNSTLKDLSDLSKQNNDEAKKLANELDKLKKEIQPEAERQAKEEAERQAKEEAAKVKEEAKAKEYAYEEAKNSSSSYLEKEEELLKAQLKQMEAKAKEEAEAEADAQRKAEADAQRKAEAEAEAERQAEEAAKAKEEAAKAKEEAIKIKATQQILQNELNRLQNSLIEGALADDIGEQDKAELDKEAKIYQEEIDKLQNILDKLQNVLDKDVHADEIIEQKELQAEIDRVLKKLEVTNIKAKIKELKLEEKKLNEEKKLKEVQMEELKVGEGQEEFVGDLDKAIKEELKAREERLERLKAEQKRLKAEKENIITNKLSENIESILEGNTSIVKNHNYNFEILLEMLEEIYENFPTWYTKEHLFYKVKLIIKILNYYDDLWNNNSGIKTKPMIIKWEMEKKINKTKPPKPSGELDNKLDKIAEKIKLEPNKLSLGEFIDYLNASDYADSMDKLEGEKARQNLMNRLKKNKAQTGQVTRGALPQQ